LVVCVKVIGIWNMDSEKAMVLMDQARNALDKWEFCYLATREKIEETGTDHRWEFDRLKLFKRTKYMSKICKDMFDIFQVSPEREIQCIIHIIMELQLRTLR
jgi:dynein heavy chain, axonemal